VARILERTEATLNRRTDFRSAVAILRGHLDLRVRPELVGDDPDGSGAPWSSAGGALHLSDLQHGGFAGRASVFLVGLDAERMPGGGGQDPVLLDSDRRVLGPDLPTSAERLRERVFAFAALCSRLRGSVTMSYGAWQATEARAVGPATVLLQALRLSTGDTQLTFHDLRERMGRVVSAVPDVTRSPLDSDDVWMTALGSGTVMRQGVRAVRDGFPDLDRGLTTQELRVGDTPGAVHGIVGARAEELDPRRSQSMVLSASRLEALGTCPLRYLHSAVLRIYPPDDPELDPNVWLGHREKGSLLHEVFDSILREARRRGVNPDDREFETIARMATDERIAVLRRTVPIPGEGTLARETVALHEDVRSFIRMIRRDTPQSVALEFKFGLDDDEPVLLEVEGGTLALRGAIDRVDADLAGHHVVDYKTGGTFGYGAEVFNGGRRLQHAIYAHAAEMRLGGEVVDGRYHFPTRRGQNQEFVYQRADLARVAEVLSIMLDGVAGGFFVPTDQADDCTFCDFAAVCRVTRAEFGKTLSPLADWSSEHTNAGVWPAFHPLKRLRKIDG
jgi:ATP-dependent helicase/nuclease subunit B